jgi:hypothetical protein
LHRNVRKSPIVDPITLVTGKINDLAVVSEEIGEMLTVLRHDKRRGRQANIRAGSAADLS